MKKFLLYLLIVLTSIGVTGCAKYDYDFDINDDDQISIQEHYLVSSRLLNSKKIKSVLSKEMQPFYKEYKKAGYQVNSYKEKNLNGLNLVKTGIIFKDFNKELPIGFSKYDSDPISVKRGLVKTSYKLHIMFNYNLALKNKTSEYRKFKEHSAFFKKYGNIVKDPLVSITKEDDDPSIMCVSKLYASGNKLFTCAPNAMSEKVSNVDMSLKIKIPSKATNHNATKVMSGNVYYWDLPSSDLPTEIILEYETTKYMGLFMIFSIIIVVAGVVMLANKANSEPPVRGL